MTKEKYYNHLIGIRNYKLKQCCMVLSDWQRLKRMTISLLVGRWSNRLLIHYWWAWKIVWLFWSAVWQYIAIYKIYHFVNDILWSSNSGSQNLIPVSLKHFLPSPTQYTCVHKITNLKISQKSTCLYYMQCFSLFCFISLF